MTSLLYLLASAHASPHVAVVVIDESARDEGWAIQIDDWLVEDVLPVEIAEGEKVQLVDAEGHHERLDFKGGEAWEVTGAEGEAWMSVLEEEVRTDLIRVKGPQETITALAKSLHAEVVTEGEATYLSGEHILFEARWVEESLTVDVREVAFVRVGEAPTKAESPSVAKPVSKPIAQPVPVTPRTSATPAGRVDDTVEAVIDDGSQPAGTARPTQDLDDLPLAGVKSRPRYEGVHLCAGQTVVLSPSGLFGASTYQGGGTGTWTVSAPGLIHLQSETGALWGRVAIDGETGRCKAVWRATIQEVAKRERAKKMRRRALDAL